ncbi:MAG TPA: hypothetical protein VGG53_15540 [Mycobacterium sp.]|jgi:hypothetical protein|uniref:hypothetical protein n=1 Tax=Mycobacterium sp. TaxID=1785 RepID=UPI002F3FD67A
MTAEFSADVQIIVGPLLEGFGLVLDEVDNTPDKGGRPQHIVFYRSDDCKIQVYDSSREGEVNCMIAPVNAPNEFGLRAKKWQFLSRFSTRPDLPLDELAELSRAEYEDYANPLEWVRDRIGKYYEAARKGILEMYGTG